MSGHSKWATTKHKKAVIDAKRGKLFAKLVKNIEVAARTGGGDPSGNPTLYDAIQKARKTSVPLDNIERAVKRGSGAEGGGAEYITITYEAYGPAGVAILIECLTDNRNRSASDVRVAVTRNSGTMADVGSVQRLFSRKGVIEVVKLQEGRTLSEDDLLEATIDAEPRTSSTRARDSRSLQTRTSSWPSARRYRLPALTTSRPTSRSFRPSSRPSTTSMPPGSCTG